MTTIFNGLVGVVDTPLPLSITLLIPFRFIGDPPNQAYRQFQQQLGLFLIAHPGYHFVQDDDLARHRYAVVVQTKERETEDCFRVSFVAKAIAGDGNYIWVRGQ